MNDYEARRQERIKRNQALLAQLDIASVVPKSSRGRIAKETDHPPPTKRRRTALESTPSTRTSARIAAVPAKNYNDDTSSLGQTTTSARSAPKKKQRPRSSQHESDTPSSPDPSSLLPSKTVDEIRAGWTSWAITAEPPTRDARAVFHFSDQPSFTPNKSPSEILREGAFGGSYYRPFRSRKLGFTITDDWEELPSSWLEGLNVARYLTSSNYDPAINKFGVSCGQSIEEWEAAGWIAHEFDVRGWFQWYTRFFRGRRCEDDERQISRWRKCVGPTGRWRRTLLKRYFQAGVREVWDDGEEEEESRVSPVVHQTCLHWAFEVRQEHLDEMWEGGG